MHYIPDPSDTNGIVLSGELLKLTENLARNTHEVWAQRKLSEGWSYGGVLDPAAKMHPSLIPYEQLSESEKEYARSTSDQTIKFLLKLGFSISREGVAGRA